MQNINSHFMSFINNIKNNGKYELIKIIISTRYDVVTSAPLELRLFGSKIFPYLVIILAHREFNK